MSDQEFQLPPFRIEVVVAAPREAVRRALTDPAEVRRWFGWDSEELEAEIRFIFFDHAMPAGEDRVELGMDHTIELEADGPRTVVRIVHPGPLDDASWDDLYHDVVQGWHTFFQQLRYYLEEHAGQDRRTVFLAGQVVPAEAFAALEAAAPGTTWSQTRHQRSVAVDRWGGGLVGLVTAEPREGRRPTRGQLTVTTYGLDDPAFAEVEREWSAWWRSVSGPTRAG